MIINDFVIEAASNDMKEVELGKIAEKKAISEGVKNYGRILVKDHSRSTDDLKKAAKNNNIKFPNKKAPGNGTKIIG